MEQYAYKGEIPMNTKPDRSMIYIVVSVVLLIGAIAATSIINSRQSSQTDIRAKASATTGVVYQGIVNAVDLGKGVLMVESLKPEKGGMALSGVWTVTVPSTISLGAFSPGTAVNVTVDSKKFNIQTKTIEAKNVVAK